MKKTKYSTILFFLITVMVFFLSFYRNQWNIITAGKFRNFQYDDQSLILSRLTESRKSGIFSYGGLLGRGDQELYNVYVVGQDADYEAWYTHQYDMYLKGNSFETYYIYQSQSGAQGMVFSFLDKISPLPPIENLRIYRGIASLSFAIVISLLMLWFLTEFGWLTAVFTVIATLASPWFTYYGRNLFYVAAFFFLPIVTITYYLKHYSNIIEAHKFKLGSVAFISILLKCFFNGYDFILPTILMLWAPLIYFAVRDDWNIKLFIKLSIIMTANITAAIMLSLLVLSIQLRASLGSFLNAFTYLADSLSRRTHGNPGDFPIYAESLRSNAWDVLVIYFQGDKAITHTNIQFIHLFLGFAVFTGIYLFVKNRSENLKANLRKSKALIIATWASILSPVLWFVIFKGLAYVHTHTNFLSWYMPFTIYGFALCGFIIQSLLAGMKKAQIKNLT